MFPYKGDNLRAVEDLLESLTLQEKVALLSGSDPWRTTPIPRLGIPAIKVSDGPNGVRGDSTTGARAVCLPAAISLAASFDTDLVTSVGQLLGRETVRKGASILLAPTINMARNPLGGRNFESMGEDPLLTGAMATAYITGVQDEGVGACAKHFVANDTEYRRMTVSSQIDARVLREVYLAPFERAVEADVWSVMSAYPRLNGEHCSQNPWLLSTVLRDEWGFEGIVVSDWGATHHRSAPLLAGQDLEMPGPTIHLGDKTLAAIVDGEISEETIDTRVRAMLNLIVRSGRLGQMGEQPEQSVDLPEDRALARRAASGGMVLLRNSDLLPLDPAALKSVVVIGPNADPGVLQGGGSAELFSHHSVSPFLGLQEALPDAAVSLQRGCLSHRYLPLIEREQWVAQADRPVELETFDGGQLDGEAVSGRRISGIGALSMTPPEGVADPGNWSQRFKGTLRVEESGIHQFAVQAIGRSRVFVNGALVVDNWTDPQPGDGFFQSASTEIVGQLPLEAGTVADVVVEWAFESDGFLMGLRFGHFLQVDEDAMLSEAVAAASSADTVVVVVGQNAEWETEGHDRPLFGLPGRQAELVRRVLEVNPRTVVVLNAGGPVDMPWLDDAAAVVVAWYPGQEFGNALADVLLGKVDPGGRLPITFPKALSDTPTYLDVPGDGDQLHYREGLFVGYRWYDARSVEPLAEFGAGLSYAQFEIGHPRLKATASGQTLSFDVANTSERKGTCVVQAYVQPPVGLVTRPRQHLGGFASVRLKAGENKTVEIKIPERCFEVWTEGEGWSVPPGAYSLHIGTSSRQIVGTVVTVRA